MWHTGWTQDTDCYHHGTKYSSHGTIASVVARTMLKSSRIALHLNPNSSCSVGKDSVVGLATHYWLDGPEERYSALVQNGPRAFSLLFNGYRVSSLGVKRPGHGLDTHLHLAPKLKKEWSYTSTPPGLVWPLGGRTLTLPFTAFVTDAIKEPKICAQ